MPAVVPLVMMGVSAGVGAYSAHKQSQTAERAAATQMSAADKALAFQREQQKAMQERTQPYVNEGYRGLYNLSQLANNRPPQMPMFNGNVQGGGWTPQNFAQQTPYQNQAPTFGPGGVPMGMQSAMPVGPDPSGLPRANYPPPWMMGRP